MPDYLVQTMIPNDDHSDAVLRERLVRARSKAQAIAHVVSDTISAKVAETDDILRVAGAGGKLEQASEE